MTGMRRRPAVPKLAAIFAAGFGFLAALATMAPARAEPVEVRIGFAQIGVGNREYGSGNTLAVVHAEDYFRDVFPEGEARIRWSFFKGAGPAVNEAIANGQLDFALQGDLPSIVGRANGLETRIIAASGIRSNLYLAATPASGITSVEDLRGRKVAQFRGTNLQLATDKVLAAHGLGERDVKFINMDFPTATAALATGDIDAAFGQADFLGLEEKGIARIVYNTKGDDPAFTRHAHLLVTRAFEAKHPGIVQKVVTGLVRAAAWASDEANREELFRIWGLSGVPVGIFRADFDGTSLAERSNPRLDDFLFARYADQAEAARKHGLIRRPVDIEGWFEPGYVEVAIRELGLDADRLWPRHDAAGAVIAGGGS